MFALRNNDDSLSEEKIEFEISCYFLEIYNENIHDLLDSSLPIVSLREDTQNNNVFPEGCKRENVKSIQQISKLVSEGLKNRHNSSTFMNHESSRSHAVFTAIIKNIKTLNTGEQTIKTSRLNIVDLAGSERLKETGA